MIGKKKSFENVRVLVTGAGSGIGRELARGLVARGAQVIGVGRTECKLALLESELGDSFSHRCFDVTDRGAWQALAAELEQSGGLDMLINNAGIMPPVMRFVDGTGPEGARPSMETDFFSVLYSVYELAPVLERSGRPAVVNISSASAFVSVPGMAMYCAAKAALRAFTESLGIEQGRRWYVAAVCPGFVRTELFRDCGVMSALVDRFRMPSERMAEKIIRGIGRKRRMMVIGADARIMVVLHTILGAKALDVIAFALRKCGVELFENAFSPSDR